MLPFFHSFFIFVQCTQPTALQNILNEGWKKNIKSDVKVVNIRLKKIVLCRNASEIVSIYNVHNCVHSAQTCKC